MSDDDAVASAAHAPQYDGLIARLGIDIIEIGAARVVGTMPVRGNTQPYGLLHGGASAALAETLGSFGAMAHALEVLGPDAIAVGVDLSITHHRGMREGTVTGTATPLHLGRTAATYGISVTDERDRLIATARLTCILKTRP